MRAAALSRALVDRISYDLKYDGIKVGFTPTRNCYEPVNVDRARLRAEISFTYVSVGSRIPLRFTADRAGPSHGLSTEER